MKLVEILASAVVHGHVFHLEPGFDERVQGSPSSVVVIEERTEGGNAMPATLGIVDPQVLFSVYPKAWMTFIPQR